jgi:HTH-type transcriptional regulator / antitoxin HigA
MPTATYADLLADALPALIETDEQYKQMGKRYGELLGKGRSRAPEETKLMRLLGLLVEDYDRRSAMPPDDSTPAEILQFLLEHSGKTIADLLTVFGQRSHVNEALNGKRPISADQARKLANLFSMSPGLFIR